MSGASIRCFNLPLAFDLSRITEKSNAKRSGGMPVLVRTIEQRILLVRGSRVMLDRDLAEL